MKVYPISFTPYIIPQYPWKVEAIPDYIHLLGKAWAYFTDQSLIKITSIVLWGLMTENVFVAILKFCRAGSSCSSITTCESKEIIDLSEIVSLSS